MRLSWLFAALSVLGLALASTRASATLLYAGGEDVDFICRGSGTCSVDTTAQMYRAGWAREAYKVLVTSTFDPPTNRFATPTFSPASTLWIHGQYCTKYNTCSDNFNSNTTANAQLMRVLNSNGNPALIVRGTGSDGTLKISSRTSAGVFTDLVTCPAAVNASLMQLDLYVNYGTSGEVALYNNGLQVCNFTGNVTNGDGATTLYQVEFAGVLAGYSSDWSEIIIATTDTRGMSRFSANTVGNGNATGFSGTNVCSTIWNASAFNDANYAYSGSSNVSHECTINGAVPAGAYSVVALVMTARALVGTTGPLHFSFLTRTNGTDYASGDFTPLPTFSNIANYIQSVNPATSAPWAVSDFSAAGFNVGQKTKP